MNLIFALFLSLFVALQVLNIVIKFINIYVFFIKFVIYVYGDKDLTSGHGRLLLDGGFSHNTPNLWKSFESQFFAKRFQFRPTVPSNKGNGRMNINKLPLFDGIPFDWYVK